jgi:hypothetical protein
MKKGDHDKFLNEEISIGLPKIHFDFDKYLKFDGKAPKVTT